MTIKVKRQYRIDKFAIPAEVFKKYPADVNEFRWVRCSDEDGNLDTKESMGYEYVELPYDAIKKNKVLGKKKGGKDDEKGVSFIRRGDMVLMVAPKSEVLERQAAVQDEVTRRMTPVYRKNLKGGVIKSNTGNEEMATIGQIKKIHESLTATEEIKVERG